MTDGLIVNRGLLTHGDAINIAVFTMRLNKAVAAGDVDAVLAISGDNDRLIAKMVVAVPDGWLPKGVSLSDPDWLKSISQEHFDLIGEAVQPPVPGKKTD